MSFDINLDNSIKENNNIVIENINNLININKIYYAKQLALELIKKDCNYKYGYLVLSDIYYEECNYKAVIDLLDDGLKYIKDDIDLLENKIDALINTYQYDEAKNIIEKLIQFGYVNYSIYGQYGIILSIEGKYKEAIEKYKKAICINKNDIISMINMSVTYKTVYRYDDALNILENALYINKNDANIIDRINSIKYLIENSKFEFSNLILVKAIPDRFNLLVPEDFNAIIDSGVLKFSSKDSKMSIIISYSDKNYDEKDISTIFSECKGRRGKLYSIILPVHIEKREKYNDLFGYTVFVSKVDNNYIYNAIAIVSKGEEAIILTMSSTITVSEKLILFTNEVINSLYFKY